MAKASATVDPFAAAKPKATRTSAASSADIYPAVDFVNYDGAAFTAKDCETAIVNYVKGHELESQGETMTKASRPVILAMARTFHAMNWAASRVRPDNPIVASKRGAGASTIKVIFQDSVKKLNDTSYTALANLIGAEAAEANTVKSNDFIINSDVLGEEVVVKKDGKQIKQNVLLAMKEALKDRFAPSPEILAALFTVVHRFETVKGLIDKGPQLVCPQNNPANCARLAQFLELGGFTTQLKPGAHGT